MTHPCFLFNIFILMFPHCLLSLSLSSSLHGMVLMVVLCTVWWKKNDSNVFYRSHLKLVSQSYYRELISCQGSGAHWKLKKSWAASISLDNNLLRQIYFPRADYDREQSPLIISETTQHNATWLLDLQGNLLWLSKIYQCRVWISAC